MLCWRVCVLGEQHPAGSSRHYHPPSTFNADQAWLAQVPDPPAGRSQQGVVAGRVRHSSLARLALSRHSPFLPSFESSIVSCFVLLPCFLPYQCEYCLTRCAVRGSMVRRYASNHRVGALPAEADQLRLNALAERVNRRYVHGHRSPIVCALRTQSQNRG